MTSKLLQENLELREWRKVFNPKKLQEEENNRYQPKDIFFNLKSPQKNNNGPAFSF